MSLYENLGNVSRDFDRGSRRIVEPGEKFYHPLLALKRYHIVREGSENLYLASSKGLDSAVDSFLVGKIESGRLFPELGLGFVMLGHSGEKGFVNICRWMIENPIVPRSTIYTFEGRDAKSLDDATEVNISGGDSSCMFELGIISPPEVGAWWEFLGSGGAEEDKKRYMNNLMPRTVLFER